MFSHSKVSKNFLNVNNHRQLALTRAVYATIMFFFNFFFLKNKMIIGWGDKTRRRKVSAQFLLILNNIRRLLISAGCGQSAWRRRTTDAPTTQPPTEDSAASTLSTATASPRCRRSGPTRRDSEAGRLPRSCRTPAAAASWPGGWDRLGRS